MRGDVEADFGQLDIVEFSGLCQLREVGESSIQDRPLVLEVGFDIGIDRDRQWPFLAHQLERWRWNEKAFE